MNICSMTAYFLIKGVNFGAREIMHLKLFLCCIQLIIITRTTTTTTIIIIIESITKFLIVIGSPRAHLSHNQRTITWVSNKRCLIWTFSNGIPVIGYSRDSHTNYACFNGFLHSVSSGFQNLYKVLPTFSLQRSSQKTFWIPKFVIDTIN